MILLKTVQVVVQSIDPCGSDDPGLSHPASEHLSETVDPIDKGFRPRHEGTHGRAQAFRKADRYGIGAPGVFFGFDAAGGRGIPEPGPVEMDHEVFRLCQAIDITHLFDGINASPSVVMGILKADQFRYRQMMIVRADRLFDLRGIKNAPDPLEEVELDARDRPAGPSLKIVGMRGGLDDHLVSWLGVRLDRNLIGHRSGGHEDRRLFSEDSGHLFLEGIDRRIFPEDVIADLRLRP